MIVNKLVYLFLFICGESGILSSVYIAHRLEIAFDFNGYRLRLVPNEDRLIVGMHEEHLLLSDLTLARKVN